ncbi:hypothetical protein LEM8419_02516 [Neolewinella maritima]|uniref:Gcp-like domain-containing protein n=1 Tax=Neolewinella maritima TaxID=1383882 RepID=A0ABN8FA26_9BACT|nr:tRNA (adenosine(37)-N6)-threonylcarbamoyltransferase complex dimerization subunit type 1 TsaB [Neolewinella maritima]CAH1001611.1 hypothetical protein LEM8419_02516 [Neolewinella maritima]
MELLLETATEVCSVAVAHEGRILAEVAAAEVQQHASHLTRFITRALAEAGVTMAQLTEVVLSDGPGSFTSLRVGAATAKGLCMALPGLHLSVVPTLAALAHGVADSVGADHIMATLTSRRGEVYGQLFTAGSPPVPRSEIMNVRLTDPQWRGKLLGGESFGRVVVCGPGQARLRAALDEADNAFRFAGPVSCSAGLLLAPARRRPPVASYEPFYLNPPFVTKSKKRPLL